MIVRFAQIQTSQKTFGLSGGVMVIQYHPATSTISAVIKREDAPLRLCARWGFRTRSGFTKHGRGALPQKGGARWQKRPFMCV